VTTVTRSPPRPAPVVGHPIGAPQTTSASLDKARQFTTRFALVCLYLGIVAGLVGSLSYTPVHELLRVWGLTLKVLRPMHLAAGTAWIYLGGIAVLFHHWSRARPDSRIPRAVRFFLATWLLGGLVVAVTLFAGHSSGREYFFVTVPSSVLFWTGWVVLAWAYVRTRPILAGPVPVYQWMWMTSLGLFTYAFVETHVFLLPYFQSHPLRDMAVEWKSYGTLVGSFNLLVYGSLSYLGDRLNPGGGYARSRLAFALFWVGVLNSFTNYGHHTYHLPQSMIVKWTSFTISMTEIVILAKVVLDLAKSVRKLHPGKPLDGVSLLLVSTTAWTFVGLTLSMVISVPLFNSLIHGTFVVAGHAMGSMLGIDTMALLAVLGYLHIQDRGPAARLPRWAILAFNAGILTLWLAFLHVGTTDSLRRWNLGTLPSASLWPGWFGYTFMCGGLLVATGVVLDGSRHLAARPYRIGRLYTPYNSEYFRLSPSTSAL
jgi:nitric oxide reductase subunit B